MSSQVQAASNQQKMEENGTLPVGEWCPFGFTMQQVE